MIDNWEHIIKNKFQNETLNPPPQAWESINDSSWTQKIKQKSELSTSPSVPTHLTQKVFLQNQIQTFFSGLGIKAAAVLIGVSTSAVGWYYVNQKSVPSPSINPPIQEQITSIDNNEVLSSSQNSRTLNLTNPSAPNSTLTHKLGLRNTGNATSPTPLVTRNPEIANTHVLANDSKISENTNEIIPDIELYSQTLQKHVFETFGPFLNSKYDSKSSRNRSSHLKTQLQVYAGVKKSLNTINYINTKERLQYQHAPMQRNQGVNVGAILNNRWILETGLYQSYSKSTLNLRGVPFHKTPLKIHPQRKILELKSPYNDGEIDVSKTEMLPPGANWRDSSKFYKVNFVETHYVDLLEIPISIGYQLQVKRFLLSAQLGGLVYIPRNLRSDFTIQIQNTDKTTFSGTKEKTVRNKYLYQGFAQIQVGYRITPAIAANFNAYLPGLSENNPNKALSTDNLRFQMGLNYSF